MPVIWMKKPSTTTNTVARRHGMRRSSLHDPPLRSSERAAAISASSTSGSVSGSRSASTRRASAVRPRSMYQRAVSGSRSSINTTSAAGTAARPSSSRQLPAPANAQATR